jgi:hypothetical protein
MDAVAEIGSAAVGAVAAGAESAVVATAPAMAAAAEGTVIGAASSAAPVAMETGVASVEDMAAVAPVATETVSGVMATTVQGSENVAAVAEASVAIDGIDVSESVVGSSTNENDDATEDPNPPADVVARRLIQKSLAEQQRATESATVNNGSIFAKDQVASMVTDTEGFEKFQVPKAIQADKAYQKALRSVIEEAGGDPNDEDAKKNKNNQAEAYWRYWHGEAERQIEINGGYIDHEVYGTKEWGAALALAHTVNDKRKADKEEPFTPIEVNKIAYAFYLEDKNKKRGGMLKAIGKAIGAFFVAGGQDFQKEARPELENGGQRRR